jgi:MFS family permease
MITFAGAVGALAMKPLAQPLVKRAGFRPLLVWNSLICGATLIATGFLDPRFSAWLLIAFLLVSGFFRSLQFTCVNTLAFADVDESDMSQATSFSSTAQQLALSIGVGIGSQALNVSLAARHARTLAVQDFTAAFCTVGLISLLALPSFLRLKADAGSSVSGHRLATSDLPARATHP